MFRCCVLALACHPPSVAVPVPVPAPVAEVAEEERSAAPPSLEAQLDARKVTDTDFIRRQLYSWTTPAQIAELARARVLLEADPSTGGRASPYSRLITELAPKYPMAAALRDDPNLIKRRYAWPTPFATVLGRGPRRYGTSLIAIELKADALIVRLDPRDEPPFTVFGMDGRRVADPDASKVGAVFHVRAESGVPARFREYIVCNEAMVARWGVATPELAAVVADDVAMLQTLLGAFTALTEAESTWPAAPRWHAAPERPTLVTRWHATLAFDNVRYRPSPRNLQEIIDALHDYEPGGDPLVVAN